MRHLHIMTVLAVHLAVLASCSGGSSGNAVFNGLDGGNEILGATDPCAILVASVCGTALDAGICQQSVECQAARLTAEHERENCPVLLGDPRYVACQDRGTPGSACDDLVRKTCGSLEPSAAPCGGGDTCINARDVATDDDENVCHQALGDNSAFPACVQH